MPAFQPKQNNRTPAALYEAMATPLVTRMLLAGLVLSVLGKAARYSLRPYEGLTDFDAFHIAGQMVWRGDIADAYHFPALLRAQSALTGNQNFLPWSYPPPFDIVVAVLALLPIPLAYLLFVGTTLAAYLLVLRRIAGPLFPAVLIALLPTLFMVVACGQNGFLTGTLVGLASLGLLRSRASAGVPLGLMAIKPHLALGLGFGALSMRRWACLAMATVTAALASLLATALLGPAIWPAFLSGLDEAKTFLAAGEYPLFRMISVYAWLRSFDAPAALALVAQIATALAVLGLTAWAAWRKLPARQVVGLATITGLLVSPYAYDYDLPLYGIGLALLLPDLIERASRNEHLLLLGLGWLAGGSGFVMTALSGVIDETDSPIWVSVAGPVLVLMLVLIVRILLREPRRAEAPAAPAGPVRA